MSDLIEIYKENINTILNRIGKILDNLSSLKNEKIEIAISDAENGIKEAERIVRKKINKIKYNKN
jgi:hypothetical protein